MDAPATHTDHDAGPPEAVSPAPSGEQEVETVLGMRVEPAGPAAERAIAAACAGSPLHRDTDAPLGRPAAIGECIGGVAALEQLVRVAAAALDDTDLHLTVRRR